MIILSYNIYINTCVLLHAVVLYIRSSSATPTGATFFKCLPVLRTLPYLNFIVNSYFFHNVFLYSYLKHNNSAWVLVS